MKNAKELIESEKTEKEITGILVDEPVNEKVEFRKLAKSKNVDIVTPEGRYEIEVKNGKPKYIIMDGTRLPVEKNQIFLKYEDEIKNYFNL